MRFKKISLLSFRTTVKSSDKTHTRQSGSLKRGALETKSFNNNRIIALARYYEEKYKRYTVLEMSNTYLVFINNCYK